MMRQQEQVTAAIADIDAQIAALQHRRRETRTLLAALPADSAGYAARRRELWSLHGQLSQLGERREDLSQALARVSERERRAELTAAARRDRTPAPQLRPAQRDYSLPLPTALKIPHPPYAPDLGDLVVCWDGR
jgi:predicted  nucleic acid-binding Zn-ribbon protein